MAQVESRNRATSDPEARRAVLQQISRRDDLAIVIRKFEGRSYCSALNRPIRYAGLLQLIDHSRVNRLNLGRNVLGNELFAVGVDFVQPAGAGLRC